MPRTTHHSLQSLATRFLIVVICLAAVAPLTSLAQSADEAALRGLTERFFTAYQSRDLDNLVLLWSQDSPNLAAARQTFRETFEANKIELKSLTIDKIVVESGTGSVRVRADIAVIAATTGKPAEGFGKMNRTLSFVREAAEWKIWQYTATEEELASALAAAKTDEERKSLVAENKALLTAELVKALLMRGKVLYEHSAFWSALPLVKVALEVAERNDDRLRITRSLRTIGNIQIMLGQYEQAKEPYYRAIKIAEAIDDKQDIAGVMVGLGVIHHLQGNLPQAIELLEKALQISRATGDKQITASALSSLGSVERSMGNYTKALSHYQISLELYQELKDDPGVNRGVSNLGLIYASLGNLPKAVEQFEKSLALREKRDDKPGIITDINHIAGIYMQQRNTSKATEYFRKNLDATKESGNKVWYGVTLDNLGLVYQWQGDYIQALDHFQKSKEVFEEMRYPEGICHATTDAAMAQMSLGKYAQAVESASRCSMISLRSGFHDLLIDSLVIEGEAYSALGQPEKARLAFGEAISAVEELRGNVGGDEQQQERFFEMRTTPYHHMVELLSGQSRNLESFSYAERAKGRALLDTLKSGRLKITGAMTPDALEEERRLNAELVRANSQLIREKVREQPDGARLKELEALLNTARLNYETMQMNLYAAHPELRVHRGQMEPISLDRAGQLIPDPETALLEYVVNKNTIQLFVLTRGRSLPNLRTSRDAPDLKVYTLKVKQADLANQVERFRNRLASRDFGARETARQLYDLLVAPARAELKNKRNLIIVPDDVLWDLPFQALQSAPRRYLIEDAAISYAPSLTVLLEMTKQRPSGAAFPTLLAFGNPSIAGDRKEAAHSALMDERLDPLPEAERQVKELAKLYGPSRSRIYIGRDAQEAKLKTEAAAYSILHLATHGILNDQNPMYSQVMLSQPEGDLKEDGILEAWEIMKLDLKADLVVLSACETARGKVGNGEGMIGLTWAFFVAGVPTTIASQWSVEAGSTTELMVEFHRNLERHKSKAESLRQAMLKLLKSKEYNRPFYWAGFVVVGNGR